MENPFRGLWIKDREPPLLKAIEKMEIPQRDLLTEDKGSKEYCKCLSKQGEGPFEKAPRKRIDTC